MTPPAPPSNPWAVRRDKIQLFGCPDADDVAYEIRDFLGRTVVEFDWTPLETDDQARNLAGVDDRDDPRLPICILPNGDRLEAATVASVAGALGWIAEPRHAEYDVCIYGAGPSGLSAAVYAASEGLRTVLVERQAIGGQAGTSSKIENYLGFPGGISGAQLAERARQQAVAFGVEILLLKAGEGANIRDGRLVGRFTDGTELRAKANICATGVEYRRLNLPDEARLLNRGLYYGAGNSEAPLCRDQQVYVVGGGNSAGQAAMNFARHARRVTILVRAQGLAASMSHYLLDRIEAHPRIDVVTCCEIVGLEGGEHLSAVTLRDNRTGGETRAETRYVFAMLGGRPNTGWARELGIACDDAGYLLTGQDAKVDAWPLGRPPYELETSWPGLFAAGDVRHGSVKRVASAVGEGAMAITQVHRYLAEVG